MDHHFFTQLNKILEVHLNDEDLPLEGYANPFMHLLSEHSIYANRYSRLCDRDQEDAGHTSYDISETNSHLANGINKIKKLIIAKHKRPSMFPADSIININRTDVIIVSVIVKPEHLLDDDDFYFGPIQRFFESHNIRSLMIYFNQSGVDEKRLSGSIKQSEGCKKIILPSALCMRGELNIFRRLLGEIYRVIKKTTKTVSKFERRVLRESIRLRNVRETAVNLRIYFALKMICKRAKPKMILTLYEGHAWEKLAWRAAREMSPKVKCVGYQHSVLRKHAYGILRFIRGNRKMNPDALLTLGGISQQLIEDKIGAESVDLYVYGSHRKTIQKSLYPQLSEQKCVLVTPEGIKSENLSLINFAYQCSLQLTNYLFIIRLHPALTFESLPRALKQKISKQDNIVISTEPSIQNDFDRAGYLIYRGSSTALHGILSGLKPFYVDTIGTPNIDPLFSLDVWRQDIHTPEQFVHHVKALENCELKQIEIEWNKALDYCNDYIHPLKMSSLLALVGKANDSIIAGNSD